MTEVPGADEAGAHDQGDLGFAIDLAHRAGEVLMAHYERVEHIDRKSPKDVVTEVDHLSERLITEAIRARCPDDGILAEESGEYHRLGRRVTSGQGRVWVVDPLDGTVNYANGLPVFCVSIALVIDGSARLGVIHDPTRSETFAATSTTPAMLNGQTLQASEKTDLADCVISLGLSGRGASSRARAIRKEIRVSRSMGSAALALAYVANGRFDAMIQAGGLSSWDIAAAGVIAERAGAHVTDMAGGPWLDLGRKARTSGVIAAPPLIHARLTEMLAGR
jgi:myo-inositol-1(or 4)-monophosphatase